MLDKNVPFPIWMPGKIGAINTIWDKSCSLIGQKQQHSFQWTHSENFSVETKRAGEQACKLKEILFILLGSYFTDVSCTLHLGQMVFYIFINYFLFLLKFGSITFVYYGKTFRHFFLHYVAISFSKKKNFCRVLWRPVSLSFSFLSVFEDYGP